MLQGGPAEPAQFSSVLILPFTVGPEGAMGGIPARLASLRVVELALASDV